MDSNQYNNRLGSLIKIATDTGTDKLTHGYLPCYANNLPANPRFLLEIGCYKGESLFLWDKFFNGKTDIHTIDIFLEEGLFTPAECRRNFFVPYEGDQSDINFLSTIKQEFNVIIDDGSHIAAHMIASFNHLFVNNLKSKGVYFIEDLHCCLESHYYGYGVESYQGTILCCLMDYVHSGVKSSIIEEVCWNNISHIELQDKIVAIHKK
jgi:hypothetical protein